MQCLAEKDEFFSISRPWIAHWRQKNHFYHLIVFEAENERNDQIEWMQHCFDKIEIWKSEILKRRLQCLTVWMSSLWKSNTASFEEWYAANRWLIDCIFAFCYVFESGLFWNSFCWMCAKQLFESNWCFSARRCSHFTSSWHRQYRSVFFHHSYQETAACAK